MSSIQTQFAGGGGEIFVYLISSYQTWQSLGTAGTGTKIYLSFWMIHNLEKYTSTNCFKRIKNWQKSFL